ncbi:alpha-mannosidase [Tessaracoccus massiliensis]|uniref:alpha-mannosidase n=1 Tax=Tessaracoccus massiliensis TaxID=1522311 RepID=UPI0005918129|nr:glycoside hydrolase family 38 C-terminal domain-containing protein [Tessaracoccus massiliensis]
MHDNAAILDGRVARWLDERIRPAQTSVVSQLEVAAAPLTDPDGVVGQGEPVPLAEGLSLSYEPLEVGDKWGPAWGTTWLRFRAVVPEGHRGDRLEAFIDLGGQYESPGFQCEGLVLRPDGSVIKGHNPKNKWIPVEQGDGGEVEFYLEAASNPVVLHFPPFMETPLGRKDTAGDGPVYELRAADLVVVHDEVRALALDMTALQGVAAELPEDSARRWEIRRALDRALDRIDLFDIPATAGAAREQLVEVLAAPAAASAHTLVAVGHAHIDSAWLWPLRETRRKVARTIANQLNLLETYPEHRFAFPAAQHSAWLEEDHPQLFERLQHAVEKGQIVPVGGMWVEADANLPGGEAMCRQFLYGQQYFRRAFGRGCEQVWLPDSFGYSGGLPQLARLAGAEWFLTQKISWNQVNQFPHHTFWWEGIDGTRIFTHFPPADTYGSDLSPENMAHAARNFRDKGRSDISLVPFGYGDGGGGPTREMLEEARRVRDLEGSPRVEVGTPREFHQRALAAHESPSVWVGELYLELHRGTFTSVQAVRRGNRRNEHLLREAELWAATAAARSLLEYPLARFGELGREVCLYQFHDILPGTCISWVYDDVIAGHERITEELLGIIEEAQAALAGDGEDEVVFNAGPLAIDGVAALSAGVARRDGGVEVRADGGGAVLDNGLVRAVLDEAGRVTSLVDLATGRESIPPGQAAGQLHLHVDFPNQWDAWDIDSTAYNTVEVLEGEVAEVGEGAVEVSVPRVGARVRYSLLPGEPRLRLDLTVDWEDRDKLLKLAWPVDVHTDSAVSEIQMGHLRRPTHTNTSWDHERFETHAHRWLHVGEEGYGVAFANAQTYGWDVTRHSREGGGTYSLVRASLLKGSRFPDPRQDIGQHTFHFTVRPGATVEDAVADGYLANLPPRVRTGSPVEPLIAVDGPVLVEAVKLAEDGSGDVIVRLYEPYGARAEASVTASFEVASVVETDLHEEELDGREGQQVAASALVSPTRLSLRPFQVVTLRVVAA